MKHSHATIATMLACLLFNAGTTLAATPFNPMAHTKKAPANNYMGASIGMGETEAICDNLSNCNNDDKSWKVYSGVRLNKSIVLEGGYIGFGDLTAYNSDNKRISSGLSGYTTAGLATYQHSDQIEFFAKGGMLWWDNERSGDNGKTTNDGSSTFIGAGANYDMGDNLGIRAEWERFEDIERFQGEDGSMDLLSIGATMSSL